MWTLVSKPSCPSCTDARLELSKRGLEVREVSVHSMAELRDAEPELAALVPADHRTFPVVFDGEGNFVGGSQDLEASGDLDRFCLFPLKYPGLWDRYLKAVGSFWTPEEIVFSGDKADYAKLSAEERSFVELILAFFSSSDTIIMENLQTNFFRDITIPEARAFLSYQTFNEQVHSHTYALLIESLIAEPQRRSELFGAIKRVPAVRKKAAWALRWLSAESPSLGERLVAFACIEGIHFSGSFCAIYWLKQRGILHGLSMSNDLISRDEASHCDFAVDLIRTLGCLPPEETVHAIASDAVEHEVEFICSSMPKGALVGMSTDAMTKYVRFVADRLLKQMGCSPLFGATEQPFPFMVQLGTLESKSSFFERPSTEYSKAGLTTDPTQQVFSTDAPF